MSTRVWRQLEAERPQLPTAAQDSMLRLALALMAADVRSALTPAQRQWIIDLPHHHAALTPSQRQKLGVPLLLYLADYHPRIVAMVRTHLEEHAHDGHP